MSRALVVGAGIAGDAVAIMLGRAGWDVTVVELAPELRGGGHTVDLRGDSADVLRELGLLERAHDRLVDQQGIAWVDGSGSVLGRMPVTAFGGRGFVSDQELLRSDLSRVLFEAATRATHRFDETVDAIAEATDHVQVTFRSGGVERFDLVVGADGVHSRVRDLVFGPERGFRHSLGLSQAWFTLPETSATAPLNGWWQVHNAPGRRVVSARPGAAGEQEIGFVFPEDGPPVRRDRDARLRVLFEAFTGVGWRTDELIAAASRSPDLQMDAFTQIRMPRWHTGRVVLIGDAAGCPSPLSGMGTALALIGARSLATGLAASGSIPVALAGYDAGMRPRTRAAQKMIPGRVAMFAPQTTGGIRATVAFYRAAQARPLRAATARLATL